VEGTIGYRGVYKLYLSAGAFAALVHLAVSASQGYQNIPLVGASGACMAFLIYAACVAPRSMVLVVFLPVMLWVLAAFLVFLGIYSTYVEFVRGYPGGVAHSAHVGGAAFGFVAWKFGWFRDYRPYGWEAPAGKAPHRLLQRWRLWREHRTTQQRARTQEQIDRILEKVGNSGMTSLTASERRALKKASNQARRR
jgi:rhomboid family protein